MIFVESRPESRDAGRWSKVPKNDNNSCFPIAGPWEAQDSVDLMPDGSWNSVWRLFAKDTGCQGLPLVEILTSYSLTAESFDALADMMRMPSTNFSQLGGSYPNSKYRERETALFMPSDRHMHSIETLNIIITKFYKDLERTPKLFVFFRSTLRKCEQACRLKPHFPFTALNVMEFQMGLRELFGSSDFE